MQKFGLLFLLAIVFLTSSCNEDDFIMLTNTLHFDNDNSSSPALPQGEHEMAIKIEAEDMAVHIGKQLTAVRFYGYDVPANCTVKVYGEGSTGAPGTLLYSQDVTADFAVNAWTTHNLSTPVDLDGSDLWISIGLTHNGSLQSIGCDAGPNNAGGDWLFQSTDNQWRTFRSRTNESEDVNWNIRGIVQ